jgi:hypothetical protein
MSEHEKDPYANLPRTTLENYAAGRPSDESPSLGRARAELVRRDREYTEEQERSRREYESARDLERHQFEDQLQTMESQREEDAEIIRATLYGSK